MFLKLKILQMLQLMLLLQHDFDGGCAGVNCQKLQILRKLQMRQWLLAISGWLLAPYNDSFMSELSSLSEVSACNRYFICSGEG